MLTIQPAALKHWTRIIQRWPVDKVRPENVSFQRIMQQRLARLTNPPTAEEAATKAKVNEALVTAPTTPAMDETWELGQVNALYTLLENRYARATPLPQSLRSPASNPTHYDDLVREMAEAPSRSWLGNMVKRVKGSFRLT